MQALVNCWSAFNIFLEPGKSQLLLSGGKAMKHIVQEVFLVLIITIISVIAALFIAHSVQSETLHQKDTWSHNSKGHPTIHNNGDKAVVDSEFKERL